MNEYKNTGLSLEQFMRNQVSGGRRVIVTALDASGLNLSIESVDPDAARIERALHEAGDAAPYPYGVVVRARQLTGGTVEILDNSPPDFDV